MSDNIKLKAALDESKVLIETGRVTYQRQLEAMESDELNQQKRLGNEMMQLEEQLTKVRQENELLRIEYEQNVAANEQTGPINKGIWNQIFEKEESETDSWRISGFWFFFLKNNILKTSFESI